MDKYEYKVRADEIKALIEEGEFAEAVKIADTIDWRRVRSVMMLCTVSDLYKINRRYQESKDILLLANEKRPSGRAIVYSLCELSIKMDDLSDAIRYYQEFIRIAPKDTGKYVLLYRLFEAQEISLEERIAVLEEFKKRDYREKWAYELAYLYHRIGLTTKCIEECDEMYLWFGEGKFVLKALELKALHVQLSADQQEKYDTWIRQRDEEIAEENDAEAQDSDEEKADDRKSDEPLPDDSYKTESSNIDTELPEVKTVDVGQYNTLNLQMVVAEGLKEIMPEETEEAKPQTADEPPIADESPTADESPIADESPTQIFEKVKVDSEPESIPEVVEPEEEPASIAEQLIAPLLQTTSELPDVEAESHDIKPESLDIEPEIPSVLEQDPKEIIEQIKKENITGQISPTEMKSNADRIKYDDVLSQEYDGQIRLVVPEEKIVEKQITGQLSIEDIMAEWEEMKRNHEQKRLEDVRKRILSRTGSLFADFDEATRNGLLEELEKAFVAAMMQDSDQKSSISKVVYPSGIESKLNTEIKEQLQQAVDEAASEAVALELSEEASDETQDSGEQEPLADESDEVEELEEIIEPEVHEEELEKPEETVEPETIDKPDVPQPVRELSDEEQELFGNYVQHKKSKEQLVNTLDNMSMAAYTGNVIITGEDDGTTMPLAKNLIREMQYSDSNFSGKVAKISASALNKKDVADTLKKLNNGALIIEKAADLNTQTVAKLNKVLENDNIGLLLILEDTRNRMNGLLSDNAVLTTCFNLRVDVEPLDDEALVAYAKQYAKENEYSIDEFGILALHTRIADMQTSDHEVSVSEVRELVDDAIYYANKKTPGHFFDILLAKRYDEEDMIILREKDFMHY